MLLSGDEVVRRLLELTDGEVLVVDDREWFSLGVLFEVRNAETGDGEMWVGRDELQEQFEPTGSYDVAV